jgi:hypothetical protein
MSDRMEGTYWHRQWGPWWILLSVLGGWTLSAVVWAGTEAGVRWFCGVLGLIFLALAASFAYLTVWDDGEGVVIAFGPMPLARRRVVHDAIRQVERSRTTWLEGWGIHLSVRGGWVWNIWGMDCVRLDLTGGRKLWIGTDDPEGLRGFLVKKAGIRHNE